MRERLIIISDLWGREKSKWLINYTHILKTKFDLVYYDSCEIGKIDKSDYDQDNLHQQFVNGGIEIAVEKLIEQENSPVNILAFSVGGVIAWKFGLRTDYIKSLICVSSTRLRKETKRPKGKIELYFGENDNYQPKTEWIKNMKLEFKAFPNKGHQIYLETEFAQILCERILKNDTTTLYM
ncbi:alpha/beta hydrolase [uncultured Aquimarina sp.]|uniref:alpha/beta hydrolase n=1 Tax=uncultured Aquimarina sp. TaxID=575652 RepID=UPI0026363D66|nr:alpha/beta hydrolase [uncultured Aquimarina sp.]